MSLAISLACELEMIFNEGCFSSYVNRLMGVSKLCTTKFVIKKNLLSPVTFQRFLCEVTVSGTQFYMCPVRGLFIEAEVIKQ